jgi:Transcriptional Coactivator p15 (PC4)
MHIIEDVSARKRHAALIEPVTVAEWWKNRSGQTIRIRLARYENHEPVDIRTFITDADGKLRPSSKGFTCRVRHLPRLIKELNKAATKARELGLLQDVAP